MPNRLTDNSVLLSAPERQVPIPISRDAAPLRALHRVPHGSPAQRLLLPLRQPEGGPDVPLLLHQWSPVGALIIPLISILTFLKKYR